MDNVNDIVIRPFANTAERQACVRLEQVVWGPGAGLDIAVLSALQRHGGIALGAFTSSGEVVGFAISFLSDAHDPAARNGLSHHSHIAAVKPELKDAGLGERIKLAQRDEALARGVNLITWTFDPLESRNAAFNLRKLGAIARVYLVNAYGVMDDALNAGMESDRFEAEWWLDNSAPWRRGRATPVAAREIEIPLDFQRIKRDDLPAAREWRFKTRAQFLEAFGQGFVATGFSVRDGRGFYALTRWQ